MAANVGSKRLFRSDSDTAYPDQKKTRIANDPVDQQVQEIAQLPPPQNLREFDRLRKHEVSLANQKMEFKQLLEKIERALKRAEHLISSFETEIELSDDSDPNDLLILFKEKELAEKAGIDMEALFQWFCDHSCELSPEMVYDIAAISEKYLDDGLKATVTFVVNGTEFVANRLQVISRCDNFRDLSSSEQDEALAVNAFTIEEFELYFQYITHYRLPNFDDLSRDQFAAFLRLADVYGLHEEFDHAIIQKVAQRCNQLETSQENNTIILDITSEISEELEFWLSNQFFQLYARTVVCKGSIQDEAMGALVDYLSEILTLRIPIPSALTSEGFEYLKTLPSNICLQLDLSSYKNMSQVPDLREFSCGVEIINSKLQKNDWIELSKRTPTLLNVEFEPCDLTNEELQVVVSNCSNLRRIVIKDCPGITSFDFSSLARLSHLNASGTSISDESFANLKHLKLIYLDLSHCQHITGKVFQHLYYFKYLIYLNVEGEKYTDLSDIRFIQEMESLEYLNLSGHRKLGNGLIRYLKSGSNLKELWLNQTKVGDQGIKWLQVPNLVVLGLGGTQVTSVECVTRFTKLVKLDLTHLSIKMVESFSNLAHLTDLDLSETTIDDAGLLVVSNLLELTALHVNNCKQITTVGLRHLLNVEQLDTLSLVGCTQFQMQTIDGFVRRHHNDPLVQY